MAAAIAYRQIRPIGQYTANKSDRRSAVNTSFYGLCRPVYHTSFCIKNSRGIDPACGSGGMFIQSGDFVNQSGINENNNMTFYEQEKVEYNVQLCLMNMAVHGLTRIIKSGDKANTFYHDAHNLNGKCDYVITNSLFNVDKVKA